MRIMVYKFSHLRKPSNMGPVHLACAFSLVLLHSINGFLLDTLLKLHKQLDGSLFHIRTWSCSFQLALLYFIFTSW